MGSWKGKLVLQQYGLQALDGAECDRRGRDFPPSTLALAGASHIARQRLRPVFKKMCLQAALAAFGVSRALAIG